VDTDYSWVRARMQWPIEASASVDSRILHKQYYADPDEDLPVFSAWDIIRPENRVGRGNGRVIDRQLGFEQGSSKGSCMISCLLQQIMVKQGIPMTPMVL